MFVNFIKSLINLFCGAPSSNESPGYPQQQHPQQVYPGQHPQRPETYQVIQFCKPRLSSSPQMLMTGKRCRTRIRAMITTRLFEPVQTKKVIAWPALLRRAIKRTLAEMEHSQSSYQIRARTINAGWNNSIKRQAIGYLRVRFLLFYIARKCLHSYSLSRWL